MWRDIARWGKRLAAAGLVSSRFGNISVKTDKGLLIKRTGVMLDDISGPQDVVEVVMEPSGNDSQASTETGSHRAIYYATGARAIIHAHPQFAIVMSLVADREVVPLDSEGLPFLGRIPVVDGETGQKLLWDNLTREFSRPGIKGVINRGHGSFAAGPTLDDCFNTTSMIEHSCKVKYFYELMKKR